MVKSYWMTGQWVCEIDKGVFVLFPIGRPPTDEELLEAGLRHFRRSTTVLAAMK
jgi:hypothetical protein